MLSLPPSFRLTHFSLFIFLFSFFTFLFSFFTFPFSLRLSAQQILPDTYKFGWAGGLNAPQFNAIDLNLDGIKDLLVFDRHGNRKLTFINHGSLNTIDYTYHPEYASQLPDLHDWVILADYNCDGKEDIFTYSNGGARVFKNISVNSLQFELVTNLLESYYYNGYIGILLTSVDYPAIADIDGDGDLDLLSFFGLGSYVEYHKNLSMEKFGNCDSLDYRLTDHCWGKFKESEGGNHITLNAVCPYADKADLPASRHTGSTLLATDLNGDGLKDLVLGDVDFSNLIALINGGTPDSAFMISQDTAFPANSRAVSLFSFPSANLIDLDNDETADLVVTPFDPSLYISENYSSVWFYKNTGSNARPVFEFQTNRLFQEKMLDFGSSSFPLLYDMNNDGLQDLIVSSYGYYDTSYYENAILHSEFVSRISYFQNTGSASEPFFQLISEDLGEISAFRCEAFYPGIGDLNGDNKPDLLLGQPDGSLVFLPNSGNLAEVPSFGPPQWNYQMIDVGEYSSPQVIDLDKDGLNDLVIGERNGNLNFFRNSGNSSSPVFTLVTDSLGKINVTDYDVSYDGFSHPFFFRDTEQRTLLVVGSDAGKIHFFKNIDHHLEGKFSASDSLFSLIGIPENTFRDGWRSAASLAHLSDPSVFDMITGNFAGGLSYYSRNLHPGFNDQTRIEKQKLQVYPNPANQQVCIDCIPSPSPCPSCIGSKATHDLASGAKRSLIRIFNSLGLQVFNQECSFPANISTAGFPPGIYLISTGNLSQKLIIRH